jgi:hypothetical protein
MAEAISWFQSLKRLARPMPRILRLSQRCGAIGRDCGLAVIRMMDAPFSTAASQRAAGVEQQSERGADVGRRDIGRQEGLHGRALRFNDRDAQGCLGKHHAAVATVADGHAAVGTEVFDIALLGDIKRPGRQDDELDRKTGECLMRATEGVRGHHVDCEAIGKTAHRIGDARPERAVTGQRTVEVRHQVVEAPPGMATSSMDLARYARVAQCIRSDPANRKRRMVLGEVLQGAAPTLAQHQETANDRYPVHDVHRISQGQRQQWLQSAGIAAPAQRKDAAHSHVVHRVLQAMHLVKARRERSIERGR